MNTQKKLIIGRGIFFFIVFVLLGVMVVTEKSSSLLIPKIQEKMNNYIDNNYKDIKDELNYSKISYKYTKYTMKVSSKENKNHYFYIYYENKKLSDTYKKDYIEGKNLLTHINKDIENKIKQKTNTSCKVEIPNKLNDFTPIVQKRLIQEDDILNLKFYIITKEIYIDEWKKENISLKIDEFITKNINNNITPKSYKIIITNKNDITNSIEISNITNDFIKNTNKIEIINDIINDNNSNLLKTNKIKYKYLN